jgi:hypothetical protein
VGSFPVGEQNLSQSETLKFGFTRAEGTGSVEGSLQGGAIRLKADTQLRQPQFLVQAQSKVLEQTLKAATADLKSVNVAGEVNGTLDALKLSVSSNLAEALERGFARQLQAKLAQARAQLDAMIQERIGRPRAELTAKYNAARAQITSQIDERKKQAEGLRAQLQARIDQLTRQASPQGKALDSLKKKLPFGH